jgi:type I restriction enzyme M protein
MLPKWIEKRYLTLRETFSDETFRFEDAARALHEAYQDDKRQINVVLSQLRKGGVLTVEMDQDDARRKIYRLHGLESVVSRRIHTEPDRLTRGDLETVLKGAADLIRTRVDYSFILVLLFYKRFSDKWEAEFEAACEEAVGDGLSEAEAREEARNALYHDFDIPAGFLWEEIRKEPARLPENFSRAMKTLAERNPDFKDVFGNVDFVQFTTNRDNAEVLRQLVELFSACSLRHVSPDILGDAYEWILRYFAPQKAKEGEVYTPREVIDLIVRILDPRPGESVYDPASGSGGMLIAAYEHVSERCGRMDADKLFLFGQEANPRTLALSKMNLHIHDIRNARLVGGDTLLLPKFKEGETIRRFDVCVSNPPWNQDGYAEETLKRGEFWRERFARGFPTKQSADWAWIQHLLASTREETGRIGVVIDNGCLFRGGKEKAIRRAMVEDDVIEAIILLPEKLFYNTGAPGAILILRGTKPAERKGRILFINASREFESHPEVRKLNRLGESHIEKIAGAYGEFGEIEGFSQPIPIEQIRENEYNLNVTLYVFPEEEVEEIDVAAEWRALKRIEADLGETERKIEGYLEELGIEVEGGGDGG